MSLPIGMHGVGTHHARVRALGVSYVKMSADTFADPAFAADWQRFRDSGLDFILDFFLTEARLFNTGGCWERDVAHIRGALEQAGLLARCIGLMPATDEIYSHAAAAPGLAKWGASVFPGLSLLPPSTELAAVIRRQLVDRWAELARIWGPLPRLGCGIAETGGVGMAALPGQAWWALNVYRLAGYWSYAQVDAIYHAVRRSVSERVIPVIPLFTDHGVAPVSLLELGQLYLPHLDALAADGKLAGIEFFAYDMGDHPGSRGIRQLDGGDAGERHQAVQFIATRYRGLTAA